EIATSAMTTVAPAPGRERDPWVDRRRAGVPMHHFSHDARPGAGAASSLAHASAKLALSARGAEHHPHRPQLADEAARTPPASPLSAYNERRQRELALASGFQAYLVKPFDATVLVREIRRLAAPQR